MTVLSAMLQPTVPETHVDCPGVRHPLCCCMDACMPVCDWTGDLHACMREVTGLVILRMRLLSCADIPPRKRAAAGRG